MPPALWNPNAAACWCLLFSPAFGAYLHARNAEAMGRLEEAKANRMWFKISLVFFGLVVLSAFFPAIPDFAFKPASLGLLFGWYFSTGKPQIQHVKETYNGQYPRKPWMKVMLIALGCAIVYTLAVTLAILLADAIHHVEGGAGG